MIAAQSANARSIAANVLLVEELKEAYDDSCN